MNVGVVIAAAGSSQRMGGRGNKVLFPLHGKPIILYSLELFASLDEVGEIVVVTRAEDQKPLQGLFSTLQASQPIHVIPGGEKRQESVYHGLQALSGPIQWVIIHDGARPYITKEIVRQALQACFRSGAVAVGVPVQDTIKIVEDGQVINTPTRSKLWAMQTPQIFSRPLIERAHREAKKRGLWATDDCALVEAINEPVRVVLGDYANIKITTPEDLPRQSKTLTGFGWDVHRLVEKRPLVLGGVEIPFEKGLLGHSDADVLTHALMDALLGALGRGDLGELFPDTDPRYEKIASLALLKQVAQLVKAENALINNIDLTILAERPKISPWKAKMRQKLAQVLTIPAEYINIKATTAEGLGFVGREEGIAASAVVSLAVDAS